MSPTRPAGNRYTLAERLSRGTATGALLIRSEAHAGSLLRVRRGPHGRSLYAATPIAAGQTIAHLAGTLHEGNCWPAGCACEVLHVRHPTATRPGAWLLLNTARLGELGNLVNTAGTRRGNNARLVLDARATGHAEGSAVHSCWSGGAGGLWQGVHDGAVAPPS